MFPLLIFCCHLFKQICNPNHFIYNFLGFGDIRVGLHFTIFFLLMAASVISNIVEHQISFVKMLLLGFKVFFLVKMVMSNGYMEGVVHFNQFGKYI